MKRHRGTTLVALVGGLIVTAWAVPAAAQWQVDTKDGKANIKVGFLAQPQLEVLETPDGTAHSTNLFFRRFRILFGGKVSDKWTYFFETDSPNLGKAVPDKTANPLGVKDTGTIFMQDMFVTYNYSDAFKVDGGLILLGQSHNHLQSAATLLPVDYSPYSFLESGPTQERTGRDYGVQVRGYPGPSGNQHFEYRLGVFQGVRGVEARNPLRVHGRAVFYPFAVDNGFFYGGTFQGTRKLVAIGASVDAQKGYKSYGVDVFAEQPINKGQNGFTGQFNWLRFDGGTFLTALPKQDTYLIEAGYHFNKTYTPFVQYAIRNFSLASTADQNSLQVGIAYWMSQSHQRNLKFSAGRLHVEGKPDQTQILLQLQIFYY
jgi:hypothetical protein